MKHVIHAAVAAAILFASLSAAAANRSQTQDSDIVGAGVENAALRTEMLQVMTKLKPLMQAGMQAQQEMQRQIEQELVDINLAQVLAPEALTTRDGITQSRAILAKARDLEARRDRMSRDHMKNVDARVRSIIPTTAAWDQFWVGYNSASAKQIQLLEKGTVNQRAVIASIADIVDYMEPLVGRVSLSPKRELVFEDDVASAGFDERMNKFTALVEEEQEIARQIASSRAAARGTEAEMQAVGQAE